MSMADDIEDTMYETDEPQEGDIVFADCGMLGAKTSVSIIGEEFLGEFNTREEAESAARTWMELHQYWPSLWYQDDHGGMTPTTLE